jgi:hypothetical protein
MSLNPFLSCICVLLPFQLLPWDDAARRHLSDVGPLTLDFLISRAISQINLLWISLSQISCSSAQNGQSGWRQKPFKYIKIILSLGVIQKPWIKFIYWAIVYKALCRSLLISFMEYSCPWILLVLLPLGSLSLFFGLICLFFYVSHVSSI